MSDIFHIIEGSFRQHSFRIDFYIFSLSSTYDPTITFLIGQSRPLFYFRPFNS